MMMGTMQQEVLVGVRRVLQLARQATAIVTTSLQGQVGLPMGAGGLLQAAVAASSHHAGVRAVARRVTAVHPTRRMKTRMPRQQLMTAVTPLR